MCTIALGLSLIKTTTERHLNDLCSTNEAVLKLSEAGINKANFGCEHLQGNRGQVY